MKFKNSKELSKYLEENYTLSEIEKGYQDFNPEFFNGLYEIPIDYQGWAEQIIEDMMPQLGYGEVVPGYDLSDIL